MNLPDKSRTHDNYGDTTLLVELFGANYWNMHPQERVSVQVGKLRALADRLGELQSRDEEWHDSIDHERSQP